MINPFETSLVGGIAYRAYLVACHVAGLWRAVPSLDVDRCREKAMEAGRVCRTAGFAPIYCLLADMSLPSGAKRLALWDYASGKIVFSALVSHGSGSEDTRGLDSTRSAPRFSNVAGSRLSSLGVYRIAEKYTGKYGLSYRLDGLQNTNDAARRRAIVLHAYDCIPDYTVYPGGIAESAGCPAVSRRTMRRVDSLSIEHRAALYIFE